MLKILDTAQHVTFTPNYQPVSVLLLLVQGCPSPILKDHPLTASPIKILLYIPYLDTAVRHLTCWKRRKMLRFDIIYPTLGKCLMCFGLGRPGRAELRYISICPAIHAPFSEIQDAPAPSEERHLQPQQQHQLSMRGEREYSQQPAHKPNHVQPPPVRNPVREPSDSRTPRRGC